MVNKAAQQGRRYIGGIPSYDRTRDAAVCFPNSDYQKLIIQQRLL
jgi:hypothetical protein